MMGPRLFGLVAAACAISALVWLGTLGAAVVRYSPPWLAWTCIGALVVFVATGVALVLSMIADESVEDPLRPDLDRRPDAVKRADRENDDNFDLDPARPRPLAIGGRFVD